METLLNLGYIGLFIGSFLASTIIPLSSDIILIGLLSVGANPWICLITATVGNWGGGMTSYLLGYMGKWKWIEKMGVKKEKLYAQKDFIAKYGSLIAFMAWLPIIGDVLAIGLGFYKVNPKACAIFMFVGRFIRFLTWTILYIVFAEDFINFIKTV